MKLHVMFDKNGKIVAAVQLDGEIMAKHGRVRPDLKPGHSSLDLDVPAEHGHLSFADACRQLVVDTSGPTPCLKLGP
jgi:hypothetical protein